MKPVNENDVCQTLRVSNGWKIFQEARKNFSVFKDDDREGREKAKW